MRGRHLLRRLVAACFLTAALLFPVTGEASLACVSNHSQAFLTGFPPYVGSVLYSAVEAGQATATIAVTPGCSDGPPELKPESVKAQYRTEEGSASPGEDYTHVDSQTDFLCADVHSSGCDTASQQAVQVDIGPSGAGEQAVESLLFRVTGTTPTVSPPGVSFPSSAPVHVIDVDGANRASLEPTVDGAGAVAYSRSETFPKILIPVFLAGPVGSASVGYSVAPDPAAPATLGEDFQVLSPNPLPIGSSRVAFIELGIVNDELGEGPESVIVTLTGEGAAAAQPSSTTFTILDNEENVFPTSKFHHPRHKWRYLKSDYRIREIHVFATDEGGSEVVGAQMSLRRNRKNGDCQWLTKEGWQKKECSNRQWLDMAYDDTGELFFYRPTKWKASVGKTKIKDYTAFSRAVDGAGNVEKEFKEKRNANTFEVKRPKGK